jgi:membrane protein
MFAALGWFAVTSGFAWYAANFGNYSATWGALAGIVVLLTWLYLCAFILLLGAELNAQLDAVTRGTASSEKDK